MQHRVKFSFFKNTSDLTYKNMCVAGKCIGLVVWFNEPTDVGLCESVSLFDLLLLLHVTNITNITRKQDILTSEWAFSSVCGRKQQLKENENDPNTILYYQHPNSIVFT